MSEENKENKENKKNLEKNENEENKENLSEENLKREIKVAKLKDIFEWVYCIVIAVVLAVLIKYYLGTPTVVRMSSMYPTLEQGDRLILSKIDRTAKRLPERGDIITFEAPSDSASAKAQLDLNSPVAIYENEPKDWWNKFVYYVLEIGKTSYIKRVIGLPGEHVELKNEKVYIDGEELKEDYLREGLATPIKGPCYDFIVPDNCVFAMGDNRPDSNDCRAFGCIPLERIESKVVLRFFPFNKFGSVD